MIFRGRMLVISDLIWSQYAPIGVKFAMSLSNRCNWRFTTSGSNSNMYFEGVSRQICRL